jgi:hypothetical protein
MNRFRVSGVHIAVILIFVLAVRIQGESFRLPSFALLPLSIIWLLRRTAFNRNIFIIFSLLAVVTVGHYVAIWMSSPGTGYLFGLTIFYGLFYAYLAFFGVRVGCEAALRDSTSALRLISVVVCIVGVLFWFISVGTSYPLLVDETALPVRISSLMSEPSNMALPVGILIVCGIVDRSFGILCLSIVTCILTFSPTVYGVGIAAACYAVFLPFDGGGIQRRKLHSYVIVFCAICALAFTMIYFGEVVEELLDNIDAFISTGRFLDGRALNMYKFYDTGVGELSAIGFGFGSSEAVARHFNDGGVFDNSILSTFIVWYGYFVGQILIFIYLLFILALCLSEFLRPTSDKYSYLAKAMLFVTLAIMIGNFTHAYAILLIGLLLGMRLRGKMEARQSKKLRSRLGA